MEFALFCEVAWNLRDEAEDEGELLAWLDGLSGVVTKKLGLHVLDGVRVDSGLISKPPLVIHRRRAYVPDPDLLGLNAAKLLLKTQEQTIDTQLNPLHCSHTDLLFDPKVLVLLFVNASVKDITDVVLLTDPFDLCFLFTELFFLLVPGSLYSLAQSIHLSHSRGCIHKLYYLSHYYISFDYQFI